MRSKGRAQPCTPPHTGGPSDALEPSELATGGQGRSHDPVRAPGAHLVRRPGAARPLSAPERPGRTVAPGVRGAAERLRESPDRPGAAGAVLRRRPPAGAPALSQGRSAGDALLRSGPLAYPPHSRRLAAAVHAGDAGPARRAQPGPRDGGAGPTRSPPPDD